MSSTVLPSIQSQFVRYEQSIILILGSIGNLFIVILFTRRRLQSSCSMYLLYAAIMNSAFLLSNLPLNIYALDHRDPTMDTPSLCKIRYYTAHAWGQIARYLTVMACVDRFMLTNNNAQFRRLTRPIVARCVTGFRIIFWHIVPIHIPTGIYYFIYIVYLVFFLCVIPPVSMTIFAFLVYKNMKQLHARVQPALNINDRNNQNIIINRQDRELFKMVLSEVILYVLTTLPYPFIIFEVALTNYLRIAKNIERIQIESSISSTAGLLVYINCATPFYIYFIVSKAFRRDFKELFIKLIELIYAIQSHSLY